MVVILEAFWAVGWIAAATIGAFVVTADENGWRWALAIGMVPTLYALYVRKGLPESVRFLERKGRHAEAERVVTDFESDVPAAELARIDAAAAAATVQDQLSGETSIWSRALRTRTAALWIIWFCVNLAYYGAFIWIPSLLVGQGFTLVQSFTFTLIITLAQLPGYATAAWLIESWGRRKTLALFLIGSAFSAAFYGTADTETLIIVAGCLLSFFNLGAWGALYAIGPELYPTSIRGTGTGAAAGFGRLASIMAPLIVPPVLALGGPQVLFGIFAAAFAIAAVAAFTLPEQRGKILDD